MSLVLEMSSEPGYLRVKAIGEFSLARAKETFLEMLEALERHKVDKVLFDGLGLNGNPDTLERFYYGEFAARAATEYAIRNWCVSPEFAYVLQVPVLDPGRFGETVAVIRGMRVKTFGNLADARRWLDLPPASPADPGEGT